MRKVREDVGDAALEVEKDGGSRWTDTLRGGGEEEEDGLVSAAGQSNSAGINVSHPNWHTVVWCS